MHSIHINEPFLLENESFLTRSTIGFSTYGKLNERRNNVVWVCHALTANSDVQDWWAPLFGENKLFDPNQYFIVCPNNLGSCYGSSGPAQAEENEDALYGDFPTITTRDMARWHDLLRQKLGIEQIHVLVGPSLGGQQALEWAILQPKVFEKVVLIATNAQHSPYGIAFNESQRWAIENDPTFSLPSPDAGKEGLALARSIAMISYRSYVGYSTTQKEATIPNGKTHNAASYQRYQGKKLAERFQAHSYHLLSRAMDSHHVGRGRISIEDALSNIQAKTLCVGISSDSLFPTCEQKFLAQHIPQAQYVEIDSLFGHDGFLTESPQLSWVLQSFLEEEDIYSKSINQSFENQIL